ncbi:hypothetical protein LXL04_023403 [Taraxacum kok-saghyz]
MVSFRKLERPVSHNVALTTFFRFICLGEWFHLGKPSDQKFLFEKTFINVVPARCAGDSFIRRMNIFMIQRLPNRAILETIFEFIPKIFQIHSWKTPAYHSKSNKTKLQKERKTPAYQGRKTVNRPPESINREIRQNASRTQDPTADNQPWTARTKTSKQQQQGLGRIAAATKRPKQGQNGQNDPKDSNSPNRKKLDKQQQHQAPTSGAKRSELSPADRNTNMKTAITPSTPEGQSTIFL